MSRLLASVRRRSSTILGDSVVSGGDLDGSLNLATIYRNGGIDGDGNHRGGSASGSGRRGSSIISDGLMAIRRSLEDEVVVPPVVGQRRQQHGDSREWAAAAANNDNARCAANDAEEVEERIPAGAAARDIRALALDDARADSLFSDGMAFYFRGDDSKGCLALSKVVEIRDAIERHPASAAFFGLRRNNGDEEDDDDGRYNTSTTRRTHDRQMRHAKLVLADMAMNPRQRREEEEDEEAAENDAPIIGKSMAQHSCCYETDNDEAGGGAMIEPFMSPSARRLKIPSFSKRHLAAAVGSDEIEGCCRDEEEEEYSLPQGYFHADGIGSDDDSSFDFDLEEPPPSARKGAPVGYGGPDLPPYTIAKNKMVASSSTHRDEPGLGNEKIDREDKDIYSVLASLPETVAVKKANNVAAAFHNSFFHDSCVSDLWDSTCDFMTASRDDLKVAAAHAQDVATAAGRRDLHWAAANAGQRAAAQQKQKQRAAPRRSSLLCSRAA